MSFFGVAVFGGGGIGFSSFFSIKITEKYSTLNQPFCFIKVLSLPLAGIDSFELL